MLHFNNHNDQDGLTRDSLHKIRPLLNIVKKTLDGTEVMDYSWTCPAEASCWAKFLGLFTRKQLNLNESKIKFGGFAYTSELYQKKYEALGIEINAKCEDILHILPIRSNAADGQRTADG